MSTHALRANKAPVADSCIAPIAAPQEAASSAAIAEPSAPAANERTRRAAGYAAPLLAALALAAVAYLVYGLTADLDLAAVLAPALMTSPWAVAASLALSALSYAALVGYDAQALRVATDKSVPLRTVALGSFTSYAIGHGLGFPIVTAGTVRWRVYGAAGLTLPEVAKLTAVAGVTLWIGMAAVLGLSATLEPRALAALDRLPTALNWAIGVVLLSALVAFLFWSGQGGRTLGRGAGRVALPGWRAASVQMLLGVLDVGAAAAALWVLLPPSVHVPLPAFAAVFTGAIIIAVVSHAPAGLGAFEAAVLLALPEAPAGSLLSAVLVWRLTYTVIPLALAGLLFAAHEARAPLRRLLGKARRIRALSLPFVPVGLAALTFLGGLVLLTSGALPNDTSRIRALRHLVPLPFTEVSHLIASTAGVVLLILARGLMRRLASAWTLAVVVMSAGMVLSLAKGFDWEEAMVLGGVLSLLLIYRSAFYRRTGIFAEPLEPRWLIAVALVIGCTIWLGFAAFQDVDYSHELWWQFSWHDDASRFLRASLAAVIAGAGLSLYAMVHRTPTNRLAQTVDPDALAPALAEARRADAQLAFLDDKRFLFHEAGDAFLMYAVRGKSWIVMGDPVGHPDRAPDLMWRFLEEVDRNAGWPVFYQVSPAFLPLYLDGGLSLIKLGEEARVDLTTFTTDGRAGRDWRNAINRAKRDGLTFAILPAAEVPQHWEDLKAVSDAWLADRGTAEKGFSIGAWSEAYLQHFDIAVVRKGDRILAFANIWYGQAGGEITVDLMRHVPDVPGIMDFLFVNLMQEGKNRDFRWFNLGMAPLSGLSDHRLAPNWHKVAAFVARNGERFYGFGGLRSYKEKFRPVWEPRYLACPGGWTLPQVLVDVTALISGGAAKAVGKGGRS